MSHEPFAQTRPGEIQPEDIHNSIINSDCSPESLHWIRVSAGLVRCSWDPDPSSSSTSSSRCSRRPPGAPQGRRGRRFSSRRGSKACGEVRVTRAGGRVAWVWSGRRALVGLLAGPGGSFGLCEGVSRSSVPAPARSFCPEELMFERRSPRHEHSRAVERQLHFRNNPHGERGLSYGRQRALHRQFYQLAAILRETLPGSYSPANLCEKVSSSGPKKGVLWYCGTINKYSQAPEAVPGQGQIFKADPNSISNSSVCPFIISSRICAFSQSHTTTGDLLP